MTKARDSFEENGGPFERAEVSNGGVFEEGKPFEDWIHRKEDGRAEEEAQKTTTAASIFPNAIPRDVQFFEPDLVIIIIITKPNQFCTYHSQWRKITIVIKRRLQTHQCLM